MEEMNKKTTGKASWKERINFNSIVALFFVLFSGVYFFLIPYQIKEPKLFMGRSLMEMKPTLFPRLSVLGLLGLSIWYLISSLQLKEENLFKKLSRKPFTKVVLIFTIFVAYALSFEPLGFLLSSALMGGIMSLFIGNRNILVFGLVAVAIPLAVFFIFIKKRD